MKILTVSDEPSDRFFRYYRPGKLDEFDLILSCGDLHPEYLEFLVTMARCPLIYVHGNHDEIYSREPEGCLCADGKLIEYEGLRILGARRILPLPRRKIYVYRAANAAARQQADPADHTARRL